MHPLLPSASRHIYLCFLETARSWQEWTSTMPKCYVHAEAGGRWCDTLSNTVFAQCYPHFCWKKKLSFNSLYKYPSHCVLRGISTGEQRAPEQLNRTQGLVELLSVSVEINQNKKPLFVLFENRCVTWCEVSGHCLKKRINDDMIASPIWSPWTRIWLRKCWNQVLF